MAAVHLLAYIVILIARQTATLGFELNYKWIPPTLTIAVIYVTGNVRNRAMSKTNLEFLENFNNSNELRICLAFCT